MNDSLVYFYHSNCEAITSVIVHIFIPTTKHQLYLHFYNLNVPEKFWNHWNVGDGGGGGGEQCDHIYWTLGNFLKPLATINLLKSPTSLGNFWKVLKSVIFLVKSFLGNWRFFLVTLCEGDILKLTANAKRTKIHRSQEAVLAKLWNQDFSGDVCTSLRLPSPCSSAGASNLFELSSLNLMKRS